MNKNIIISTGSILHINNQRCMVIRNPSFGAWITVKFQDGSEKDFLRSDCKRALSQVNIRLTKRG